MSAFQEALAKLNEEQPDVDNLKTGNPPAEPATPPASEPANEQPIKTEFKTEALPPKDTPSPQTNANPAAPVNTPEEVDDTVFYGRLSKMTDGSLRTEDDLANLITHYNELLEQAEQGFQPKFKDERAKVVYQLLADNAGKEPEVAMRTLRALSFNAEGKTAKEKLFEAYLLDPVNSDLTELDARRYFEAEYDALYSDVESNPISQRKLALAERAALEKIQGVKESFKAAEEQPRQVSEQVVKAISEAVEGFGGIRLAFSENPQENDYLNMAIEDPAELEALKNDALNVDQWWNNFVSEFNTSKGFDYQGFIREFYEMRNHQRKAQLAFQHGQKLGELKFINEKRNASGKDIADVPQPSGVKKVPSSAVEAWAAAVGVQ